MRLQLPTDRILDYDSARQQARVASEAWALQNLFCPNCPSNSVRDFPANTPAKDFVCPRCSSLFQLKSRRGRFGRKISDAAYSKMIAAIEEDATPNLVALEYSVPSWRISNLFVIPHFAFSPSMIEKRKPLGAHAERHGWVGCNLLLEAIAPDARISYIRDGKPVAAKIVREQFAALRPLERLPIRERGWTLDVLNAVRSLNRSDFTLADVYAFEDRLSVLHPNNHNIRPKIRQQLQVLRDAELLDFTLLGHYHIRSAQ